MGYILQTSKASSVNHQIGLNVAGLQHYLYGTIYKEPTHT